MVCMNPSVNYAYVSEPQVHLRSRVLDQSRGKGLGGCSTICFAHWTVGARDDWERWSRLVGDEEFGWERMRERFRRLECLKMPSGAAFVGGKWVSLKKEDHGFEGPVPVEYPEVIERGFMDYMKAAGQVVSPLNPDVNSGDPIGLAFSAATARESVRWSANWTFIQDAPKNLDVVTDSQVSRVLFDGKRAIGVHANGAECESASYSIIVVSPS